VRGKEIIFELEVVKRRADRQGEDG
jgi:hypothetical protein